MKRGIRFFSFFDWQIRFYTVAAALIVILVSLFTLTEFIFYLSTKTATVSGLMPFEPDTAVCFALTGISIILIRTGRKTAGFVSVFCACMIVFVAAFTFSESFSGLFLNTGSRISGLKVFRSTVHMSVPDTFFFFLSGISLAMLSLRKPGWSIKAYFPVTLMLTVGFFGILSFLLGLNGYESHFGFSSLSFFNSIFYILVPTALMNHIREKSTIGLKLENKLMIGITMTTGIIVLIMLHFFERLSFQDDLSVKVQNTMALQHNLNRLLSDVLDIQTSVRGYLLTDDDKYLASSDYAEDEVPVILNRIDSLMKYGKNHDSDIIILHKLVNERIYYSRRIVELRKSDSSKQAMNLFLTGYGMRLTDSIKHTVRRIDSLSQTDINYVNAGERELKKKSRLLVLINFIIQMAILGVMVDIALKGIRSRNESLREIRSLNEQLGVKVALQTSELSESEERYRLLFRKSPFPMYIMDFVSLAILEVNESMVRLFEYSEDEFMGMIFPDLWPPADRDEYKDPPLLTGLLVSNPLQRRYIKKSGEILLIETTSLEVFWKGRKALLIMADDVTLRTRSEEEIRKVNESLELKVAERTKDLEKANRVKSEFLTNITHELRTPMNAILGYTEMLGKEINDPLKSGYLASIKSSGMSLMTLIGDILDLSAIDDKKLELEFEFINAARFFNDFRRLFADRAADKRLNLIVDVSPAINGKIRIDENRLRRVISNLIENGIKFTSKGVVMLSVNAGNIKEKGKTDGSPASLELIIEVSDTGKGISEEAQKLIFERFRKIRNGEEYGGTGLGLAITESLVRLMKGTISVRSEPGRGSTFSVRIPDVILLPVTEPEMLTIPAETSAKPGIKEDIKNIDRLIEELEGDYSEAVKGFSIRQPIGEVREFGKRIIYLADKHNCIILGSFGNELVDAANSFNVESMLTLLSRFGDLIKKVKAFKDLS